jgi:hypothetical protein
MNPKIKKALCAAAAIPEIFHKQAGNYVKRQQQIAELKASNPDGKVIEERCLLSFQNGDMVMRYTNIETGEKEIKYINHSEEFQRIRDIIKRDGIKIDKLEILK